MFNGEEAEGEGEGEGEGEVDDNDMGIGGEPDENSVDTTEDFLRVFQGKTEFDSWDEFSNLFDEFQRVTGTGKVFFLLFFKLNCNTKYTAISYLRAILYF